MTQLAPIESGQLATLDAAAMPISLLPVDQMQVVLAEYDNRRITFRKWLLSKMIEGVHYGVVPGCEPKPGNPRQWKPRPSLYKAGADFLFDLFMIDPRFTPDVEAWRMLGSVNGQIVMRCDAISRGNSPFYPDRPKGEILGQGYGAGKINEKGRDSNKTIKIADKCAKVDCIINLLGISDLFTQDVEPPEPMPAPTADASAPVVPTREERRAAPSPAATIDGQLVVELKAEWDAWIGEQCPKEQFFKWAKRLLETPLAMDKVQHWTREAIATCREAMKVRPE